MRNASDVPVYEVTVTLWKGDEQRAAVLINVIPPGTTDLTHHDFGAAREALYDMDPETGKRAQTYDWGDFLVELTFRDAAGARWWRRRDGRLDRLPAG